MVQQAFRNFTSNVQALQEERRIAEQIKKDQNFIGDKVGNIGALDVDDQTKSAIKKSLIEGVDPAQLKYFKQANKDALSEPIKEYDVYQHMQDAGSELGITVEQNAPQVRPTKEWIGNILWGSPQMRGHIK